MRQLKIYVIEAILNPEFNEKTHTFVNIKLDNNKNKLATTSVFCRMFIIQLMNVNRNGINLFKL